MNWNHKDHGGDGGQLAACKQSARAEKPQLLRVYVAGAWVEQNERARPMIARLRQSGLVEITCDWTQAEGQGLCTCGHPKSKHENRRSRKPYRVEATVTLACAAQVEEPRAHRTGARACECVEFEPIKGDSMLSKEDRLKFARADLEGVLTADVVWLLAANDKGACGSWVELGAALALKTLADRKIVEWGPTVVVSGPKANRSIFTELANITFTDENEALAYVLRRAEVERGAKPLPTPKRYCDHPACPGHSWDEDSPQC